MTHDTKRSADVRARITALTWLENDWPSAVRGWMSITEELRSADGAPDDLERYFLFQTLAGAWPIERERVAGYMEKALREAKRNTNWVEQNERWERGVRSFVEALYDHGPFLRDFEPFAERVARLGDRIALGMLALKLTSPGVPDLYQGDELPLRALVDPDNRRPVDWDWYQAMLRRVMGGSPPDRDTRKLWLCAQLLGLRIRRAGAFGPEGAMCRWTRAPMWSRSPAGLGRCWWPSPFVARSRGRLTRWAGAGRTSWAANPSRWRSRSSCRPGRPARHRGPGTQRLSGVPAASGAGTRPCRHAGRAGMRAACWAGAAGTRESPRHQRLRWPSCLALSRGPGQCETALPDAVVMSRMFPGGRERGTALPLVVHVLPDVAVVDLAHAAELGL